MPIADRPNRDTHPDDDSDPSGLRGPVAKRAAQGTGRLRKAMRSVKRALTRGKSPTPRRPFRIGPLKVTPPLRPAPGHGSPTLVRKAGVAHVAGGSIPVWRLVMARRAGSGVDALGEAFPKLTRGDIRLAMAYARRVPAEMNRLIRKYGPAADAPPDVPDDGAGFESELASLLDRDGELYRRLAR